MSTEIELQKFIKKRGHYFHALDVDLAKQYNISSFAINTIRTYAVHLQMSQQEICLHITKKLRNGAYLKSSYRKKKLRKEQGGDVVKNRTEVLTFLLHCPKEAFLDITRITKYDWHFSTQNEALYELKKHRIEHTSESIPHGV